MSADSSPRRDFLLEIGTEEMPAALMPATLDQLAARAGTLLCDEHLDHEEVEVTGTPRRLVLVVRGMSERQREREERVRGPSAAAAFDPDGRPTRAVEGFARGQGVSVEDLTVEDTSGGRYVFALRREGGRAAARVLKEILAGLVQSLEFPRSMRWGAGDLRFARPIRWLLALFGGDVVSFDVAGVESGRVTHGHRVLGPGPLKIRDPAHYFEVLESAGVLVDHRRRREEIARQAGAAGEAAGGRTVLDEDILDEVNFLVEWPTAFVGRFDDDYLELPRQVLETPMKHHQRYFPVEAPGGGLLPAFVGVRNGGTDHLKAVIAGNEKVLRARLADARFFFHEDCRRPLSDYVEKLKGIVFQARLGTLHEKMERVRRLAGRLAETTGEDAETTRRIDRAAFLAKADLGTAMVYEFTELQGVMGREYARLNGEEAEVADAIYEHLLPRFAGDDLPEGTVGQILGVADRLDTVVACFAAGIQPTGSQDPYAMRRQALGIIHITRRGGPLGGLSLDELVGAALTELEKGPGGPGEVDRAAVMAQVKEFFLGRIRVLMDEEGLEHEVVEAVLATGLSVPAELWRRARAVRELRSEPDFAAAAAACKRAANLGDRAEGREVRPELLEEGPELNLREALAAAEPEAAKLVRAGDYGAYVAEVARLRPILDEFLDRTLVMVEDEAVRDNRLALLRRVAEVGRLVADLGRL